MWNEAFSEDRDTKRAFATSLVIMLAISILRKFQLSLRFSPLKSHETTCLGVSQKPTPVPPV